jgi:hypothetical protein
LSKLKEKFNFDLKQNFIYYTIYSNALLLNKKLYLLYNFWNKRKEFLLLKSNKKTSRFSKNFQGFISLNFENYENINKFDYFYKWSSSYSKLNDFIIKSYLNNKNRKKSLLEFRRSLNYLVFDSVFDIYNVNEKNIFFYFHKNNFLFNFLFKLSNKDKLRLKYNNYIYLYYHYFLLKENNDYFYNNIFWKNKFNSFFFNQINVLLLSFIVNNVKKYINLYYYNKILSLKKCIHFFKLNILLCLKLLIIKDNYLLNWKIIKNKKINTLLLKRMYFQYIHFYKKFNKRYNRAKRYMPYHIKFTKFKKTDKYQKDRFVWLLTQSLFPVIGDNIYKNFKKKNFFTFLIKNKNKNSFFRNFYKLNNLIYKFNYKDKIISKKSFKKRRKKRLAFRILKKLKTFYYIPNLKKTRKQVYFRFKRSVLYKFDRKKRKKIQKIYVGRRFNLFIYNIRNRYKNKMKDIELRKKSTPMYFFFKRKKNNYINIRPNIIRVGYRQLPYYIMKKYNLTIKKINGYFKRKDYIFLKSFNYIKDKNFNTYKKGWKFLFNNRAKKFRTYKLNQYAKFLKKKWARYFSKKKIKKTKKVKAFNDSLEKQLLKRKKSLWFFQKIALYWKHLMRLKENSKFHDFNYINKKIASLKNIYIEIFNVVIEILKWSTFYYNISRKNSSFVFLSDILSLLKYYYSFILFFFKKFSRKKLYKIYRRLKLKKLIKRKNYYSFLKRNKLALFNFWKKNKKKLYYLRRLKNRLKANKLKKKSQWNYKHNLYRSNKIFFFNKNKYKYNKYNETRKNLL